MGKEDSYLTPEDTSPYVKIGNLLVREGRVGERNLKVEPKYCDRCGGLINYREAYPDFGVDIGEISSVGCNCP